MRHFTTLTAVSLPHAHGITGARLRVPATLQESASPAWQKFNQAAGYWHSIVATSRSIRWTAGCESNPAAATM